MPDLLVNLLKLPATRRSARIQRRRAQPLRYLASAGLWRKIFPRAGQTRSRSVLRDNRSPFYIATIDREIAGFAAYECTRRGFFGPTGVVDSARGKGIGKALLLASLWGAARDGVRLRHHRRRGSGRFYQKTVGAIIIPDSEPGIYVDR